MPQIENDAAVLRGRAFDELLRFLERVERAERHDLVGDADAACVGFAAQLAELVDELRDRHLLAEEIPDLDVAAAKLLGRFEQEFLALFGGAASLAGLQEPVSEELDLDIFHAVVVEDALHLRVGVALAHMLDVGVPQAHALESGARRSLDALLELEGAGLRAGVGDRPASESPVGGDQFDVAHRSSLARLIAVSPRAAGCRKAPRRSRDDNRERQRRPSPEPGNRKVVSSVAALARATRAGRVAPG